GVGQQVVARQLAGGLLRRGAPGQALAPEQPRVAEGRRRGREPRPAGDPQPGTAHRGRLPPGDGRLSCPSWPPQPVRGRGIGPGHQGPWSVPGQRDFAASRRRGGSVGGGCWRGGSPASSSVVASATLRTARSTAASVRAETVCTPLTLRTYWRGAAPVPPPVPLRSRPPRRAALWATPPTLPRPTLHPL